MENKLEKKKDLIQRLEKHFHRRHMPSGVVLWLEKAKAEIASSKNKKED